MVKLKTGIVIVNYRDYLSTKNLIDNIINYDVIDKIVVVDNNSQDDSVKNLKKIKNKKLKIIESSINGGYAKALNIGCKYLIKEYKECNIIISNSDIIIKQEQDIITLLSYLKNDTVIVSPTILEKGNLNRGWKIPTPKDDIIMNLPFIGKKYHKKYILYDDSHYLQNTSYIEVTSGCFFIITSNHLKNINYFDENTFLYYEENILAIKTKRANKKILVDNNTKVIHNHSVTIDKSIKKINKLKILKQSQYYFQKNYNNANILELLMLKITAFLTRNILRLKYLIGINK